MKDFFISYNKADKRWAEWIAWHLEEADYTTVLQAWDFGTGSNFVLEMQKAAEEAERTIAVLSPDYLASRFTAPEWAAAFAQDPTGTGRKLIPLRVRECDPTGLLGQIVYENLVGLDEHPAKVALLNAVKRGRSKPGIAPAFPSAGGRSATSPPRFPGSLPPVWNVPHLRNPNFSGREQLLKQLRESLTSGEHAALTQAMHGLGGVGKTQTAIEYAYRYAGEYEAVLWVPAEDPAALVGHFAALGNELHLNIDPANQPGSVAEVLRWLRENSRWLLIFDNAEEAHGVRPYLPQAGTG
ncbi:MAG TPA: toll/interleukin-1 receptor domain-containing protein, partial [Longimicrobium sp.]